MSDPGIDAALRGGRVNWGILGTASIARRRFVPAMGLAKKASLVAIASREEEKARAFARDFGIPRAYGGYEALLADPDIQVVYIPLPNHLHREWTIRAARAGKHVLCEKPIAVTAGEAREMVDACRAAGVLLMEGFMYRFHPRTRKIKELICGGALGEPIVIHLSQGFRVKSEEDIRIRSGRAGGALLDVGCYCVNMSRYLYGAEPRAVFASARMIGGCDSSFFGFLEFPEGRVSLFDASLEASYKQRLQVSGSDGTLLAEKPFVPGRVGMGITILRQETGPEHFRVRGVEQFALEIDHFSSCVLSGREPYLDPEDSIANMRVIDALRESSLTGRRIEIST